MARDKDKDLRHEEAHPLEGAGVEPGTKEPKAVSPDAIIQPRAEISQRAGEVVWPEDRAGEIVTLEQGISNLRRDQEKALALLEQGQLPAPMINHPEIAEKMARVQIAQLNAMEKAFIARTKANEMGAIREVSEFNQARIKGYTEVAGEGTKNILTGVGKGVGKMGKFLLVDVGGAAVKLLVKAGKGALELTKEGVLIVKDILYDIFTSHREYRDKYPKRETI